MTRFMIAALAAVISTTASANVSAIRIDGNTAHIRYGDLNLQSHTGRTQLVDRIRVAASRICTDPSDGVQPFARANECYRVAVANGTQQMSAAAAKQRN